MFFILLKQITLKISKELKSGIIAVIALALSFWGYNYLKKQNLFTTANVFYSEFDNIQGLTEASIVTINGFQVGNVAAINFDPKKKGKLIVTFNMNEDFTFSKKSTTKITPALMGGAELSIIPSYEGENAVSGDYLKGTADAGMLNSLSDKLVPLEDKLNLTLKDADKLLVNFNNILDDKTQGDLKAAISNLNVTLKHFKGASISLEKLLADSQPKISSLLTNADGAVSNFKTLATDFQKADLAGNLNQTMAKLNTALEKFDGLMANMNDGKGSIGKLLKDEGLYNNLENASKELEELLREVKLHPKRFVHLSVFGKKDKGYVKDTLH